MQPKKATALVPGESNGTSQWLSQRINRIMNPEVMYQCNICNYVLKPKEDDPKPAYCPNCALRNQKGEMVLVGGTKEYDAGSEILNVKK